MSEPTAPRPLPGPVRPDPAPSAHAGSAVEPPTAPTHAPSFAELEHRPVAEHVAVFEDEHARLQRELGTIDSL